MPTKRELLSGTRLPTGLTDLEEPPEALFLSGRLGLGPVVALVGTRRPTLHGAEFANTLAAALARAGVVVASGGAFGVDAAAHLGALNAGGATLVVAPASFDRPYPAGNRELFERVVREGGGYLSEFDEEVVARRHHFFRRNSILVAVARAVVIVEAPVRSGARNAALWARRLGRPLFAVPHAPWNSRGGGNLAELKRGAHLLTAPSELLEFLAERNLHAVEPLGDDARLEASHGESVPVAPKRRGRKEAPPRAAATQLSLLDANEEVQRLLATLDQTPLLLDEICERSGLSAARVQALALQLSLEGRVRLHPGGFASLP